MLKSSPPNISRLWLIDKQIDIKFLFLFKSAKFSTRNDYEHSCAYSLLPEPQLCTLTPYPVPRVREPQTVHRTAYLTVILYILSWIFSPQTDIYLVSKSLLHMT